MMRSLRRGGSALRLILWIVGGVVIVLLGTWCTLAIRFSNIPSESLRLALAGAFAIGWIVAFAFIHRRIRTAIVFAAVFLLIAGWWSLIRPSHDRNWTLDVAVLPHVTWDDDLFTVHDLRAFEYRSVSDYDVHYEDRTYDLGDVRTLDFVISDWGIGDVVHTMLSFGFKGGEHLCLSIETRREQGEPQSFLRGAFKQYELIFILADERDLLGLRTTMRQEDVYVFPTIHPPDQVRLVLQNVLDAVNDIYEHPRFYNSLLHNCTLGLLPLIDPVRVQRGFDIRLLLNGQVVEVSYENGVIDTDLSYEDARQLFHVNQYVPGDTIPADFSSRIRPYRGGDGAAAE